MAVTYAEGALQYISTIPPQLGSDGDDTVTMTVETPVGKTGNLPSRSTVLQTKPWRTETTPEQDALLYIPKDANNAPQRPRVKLLTQDARRSL